MYSVPASSVACSVWPGGKEKDKTSYICRSLFLIALYAPVLLFFRKKCTFWDVYIQAHIKVYPSLVNDWYSECLFYLYLLCLCLTVLINIKDISISKRTWLYVWLIQSAFFVSLFWNTLQSYNKFSEGRFPKLEVPLIM